MVSQERSTVIEKIPQSGQLFSALDERGSWTRVYEASLFDGVGLPPAQSSVSFTKSALTLRGLHAMPLSAGEWKLVTCVMGEVWDVAVNINKESSHFGEYKASTLRGESADWVLIPPGWAHGFLTLSDNVVLSYTMSVAFDPLLEVGFRYDEPIFNIPWPAEPVLVSNKDLSYPYLEMQ
mgnify:CR=1 FL=1